MNPWVAFGIGLVGGLWLGSIAATILLAALSSGAREDEEHDRYREERLRAVEEPEDQDWEA